MDCQIKELREHIDTYLLITKKADISLAEKLWAKDAEPSLIFPRGHAKNWEEITLFYQNLTKTFSERTLTLTTEPVIHVRGDMATAEFYWNFKAVKHENGEMVETNGRESLIFSKFPEGWRIVHIHYSRSPEA